MKLSFVKMHGLGNDFVVLDGITQALPVEFDFPRAAEFLCDRHLGIGGDGLLLLGTSSGTASNAAVQMRMWNPDGSEDMCGNGLRCIVALAHARGYADENFQVQTPVGVRRASILNDDLVRVEMGKPSFALSEIPFVPSENIAPIEYRLPVGDVVLPHVTSLSTGSTHTVIFGPHPDEETFQKLSPLIENHSWFPHRTSVMWAHVIDENQIEIRIWERGAGETLACGTGACATAVAAQITGRAQTPLRVHSKGGTLIIELDEQNNIWKTGPAQTVFEGTINWP